ncbi:MAG: glycosyltransferase family 39 protein [Actinomycetota bacterium]
MTCALPDLVAVAVAGFSIGPVLLLLAGHFIPLLAIALGALGAAGAVALCGVPRSQVSRQAVGYTLVALAVVAGWAVLNAVFSGENLYAQRDPATYTITAEWLTHHESLGVPTHPEIFGSPAGYDDTSAGFLQDRPGMVYAQGNHLLPVLMACAGWLFGVSAMLKSNAIIGALALLVFFGLARRIVGAPFALVALGAVAASMPMIYVGRDAYTEPLAMLLLVGAASLLHRAVRSNRIADFALAGLVAGSAALVRIDSLVAMVALIAVGAALLAIAPSGRRHDAGVRVAALLGTATLLTIIGYLDVSQLSSGYYHNQRRQILPLLGAAGVLLVLATVAVAVVWRTGVRAVLASERVRRDLNRGVSGLIAVAFVSLASRPLWMTAHGGVDNEILRTLQRAAGQAVDGTRLYSERALSWQAMYLGWPAVLLAAVGYPLLAHRLLRQRDYALVGALGLTLSASALYLWTPQITPDQVWTMRRFVPLVLPGLVLAAVYALRALSDRLQATRRMSSAGTAVLVLGVALVLGVPSAVSQPVLGLREEVPQLAQVRAICRAVGPSGAVLEVDDGLRYGYSQTLRSFCDVPSIAIVGATPSQLGAVRGAVAATGRTLYVLAADPKQLTYAGDVPNRPFSIAEMSRWPSTLNTPPRDAVDHVVQVYLASVLEDGRVVPVA